MCSSLTGWRGGEGVPLPLAQCAIERPWPMTGKYKVKHAMIFHLFNFFIHLPPSFASQTNLHLHRESASEAHRPLAGSMTSVKLSLLRVNPPPLSCCSLETEWGLFWRKERAGSTPSSAARGEQGGETRQDRGIFPWDEVMDDGLSQSQSWAWRPPATHTHTHTTGSSYHVDPPKHSKAFTKKLELSTGQ